jgi:hypothetical protein
MENKLSKRRKELFGEIGLKGRHRLVQGYNIFMPSIKVETTNFKGVS